MLYLWLFLLIYIVLIYSVLNANKAKRNLTEIDWFPRSKIWSLFITMCLQHTLTIKAIFNMSKSLEQRSCIKFCYRNRNNATKTVKIIQKAFCDESLLRATVFDWHRLFKERHLKSVGYKYVRAKSEIVLSKKHRLKTWDNRKMDNL